MNNYFIYIYILYIYIINYYMKKLLMHFKKNVIYKWRRVLD